MLHIYMYITFHQKSSYLYYFVASFWPFLTLGAWICFLKVIWIFRYGISLWEKWNKHANKEVLIWHQYWCEPAEILLRRYNPEQSLFLVKFLHILLFYFSSTEQWQRAEDSMGSPSEVCVMFVNCSVLLLVLLLHDEENISFTFCITLTTGYCMYIMLFFKSVYKFYSKISDIFYLEKLSIVTLIVTFEYHSQSQFYWLSKWQEINFVCFY